MGVGLRNRGNDGLQSTGGKFRKRRTRPEIALDALNQRYALGDIGRTEYLAALMIAVAVRAEFVVIHLELPPAPWFNGPCARCHFGAHSKSFNREGHLQDSGKFRRVAAKRRFPKLVRDVPPHLLRSGGRRQVPLDHHPHIVERRRRHHAGNDEQPRGAAATVQADMLAEQFDHVDFHALPCMRTDAHDATALRDGGSDGCGRDERFEIGFAAVARVR